MSLPLSPPAGKGIPPNTPHTLIISLPEWDDSQALVNGKLKDVLETTYPRFDLDFAVKQVCNIYPIRVILRL